MNLELIKDNKNQYIKNITPNVILNRFDILYKDKFDLVKISDKNNTIYIPVYKNGRELKTGLYLRDLESEIPGSMNAFIQFVFKQYCIDAVDIYYSYTKWETLRQTTHIHIDLPDSIDNFDETLSHCVRYNTKRYPKKIIENIGNIDIKTYTPANCPTHIIELYFKWKQTTHNRNYHQKAHKYFEQYGVNKIYTLMASDKVLSVGFICDTGENVYFENFSYDTEYKKYSPGMVLYYAIIQDLIKQHKKKFYLLGYYDYKSNYNGICTDAYIGKIFKSEQKIIYLTKLATILRRYPKVFSKTITLIYGNLFLSRPYKHFLKDEVNKQ